MESLQLCVLIIMAPLVGSLVAGLFRQQIGRRGGHSVTIAGVAISWLATLVLAKQYWIDNIGVINQNLYTWASGSSFFPYEFNMGFLVDPLSLTMMLVVTSISLLVHIYSMGYMADDPGYQRFFSYISLFTFAMLMLVSANNFLQLFFGWEGVGLVSYLLIGFWFKRESANQGSMKAFLVNRVGDFGFILSIGLILAAAGSLDYSTVFAKLTDNTTLICCLLFVGAMGKSAQVPLHVWLPESMEGPTPISALIHAATMVTAGVFMVARMSPLFELSETALNFILITGATGALFTGLLAIVMNDIKRVVAYSTLSQLGYMMVAMGASAYDAGIFHLVTHACFKAVLFLGAGSVIIAMHHEQDMRKMGGLYQYMPITYVTCLIASLALVAIPPFSGYYSKDIIIEAAQLSSLPGATYAYYCVAIGAFVTAVYTFRAFLMTFHGQQRFEGTVAESPWSVTLPLILLAIPSAIIGFILVGPMLFAKSSLLGESIYIKPQHDVLAQMTEHYHGAFSLALHAASSPIFYLTLAGLITAWIFYSWRPHYPKIIQEKFNLIYRILEEKYGFDHFNDRVFVRGARGLGCILFQLGERRLIDGGLVNGTAAIVRWFAGSIRGVQTGFLNQYALIMVLSVLAIVIWLLG